MSTRIGVAVAAAAVLLVAGSAAGASEHNRESGGYDVGPLGQCFVPPDCGQGRYAQSRGISGFAYAPQHPTRRHHEIHHSQ
jgi:hypothetical protein